MSVEDSTECHEKLSEKSYSSINTENTVENLVVRRGYV